MTNTIACNYIHEFNQQTAAGFYSKSVFRHSGIIGGVVKTISELNDTYANKAASLAAHRKVLDLVNAVFDQDTLHKLYDVVETLLKPDYRNTNITWLCSDVVEWMWALPPPGNYADDYFRFELADFIYMYFKTQTPLPDYLRKISRQLRCLFYNSEKYADVIYEVLMKYLSSITQYITYDMGELTFDTLFVAVPLSAIVEKILLQQRALSDSDIMKLIDIAYEYAPHFRVGPARSIYNIYLTRPGISDAHLNKLFVIMVMALTYGHGDTDPFNIRNCYLDTQSKRPEAYSLITKSLMDSNAIACVLYEKNLGMTGRYDIKLWQKYLSWGQLILNDYTSNPEPFRYIR